ncbi:MAG TPA: Ig-like domain-containing protein [Allosphingosinicella sp.]|nr:Ig-like domain-containing protein [Allosphingosinicella sp.]
MAILNGTNKADKLKGTAQSDLIFGGNGDDTIDGGAGSDFLFGGNGADLITGGAGNDVTEGGNGQDTLLLSGNRADYRFQPGLFGTVTVRDLRAGSPDGTDVLIDMERVQFRNGNFKLQELLSSNAAPVAQNDSLTLSETAGKTEIGSILLANDKDPDGDSLVISAVQAVSARGASVSIGPDNKVTYDSGAIFADLDQGETATDGFTYTITDSKGLTSTATATVTITGLSQNRAPVAVDDLLALAEDAGKSDLTALVLANDTDADGDTLKVTSVQAVTARGAAVTIDAAGRILYDSGAIFSHLKTGETATDTFTYSVTDSSGAASTATATLKIGGITQVPDFYFYVAEDGEKAGMMSILQPYFNMDIESVEGPSMGGTIEFDDLAGILSFAADHDSFDRLLPDQKMESYFTVVGADGEKKLIGMVIEGQNDQIVAVGDSIAIGEGATTGNLWTSLISNEIDPDSGIGSRRIVSVGTNGTDGLVSFNASSRTLTYSAAGIDLAPGETKIDSFTYLVTDGWGSQDTATVFVTVTGAAGGGASASMAGGEAIVSAFIGGTGGSHLDDAEFASFPAMQDLLVAAAPIA